MYVADFGVVLMYVGAIALALATAAVGLAAYVWGAERLENRPLVQWSRSVVAAKDDKAIVDIGLEPPTKDGRTLSKSNVVLVQEAVRKVNDYFERQSDKAKRAEIEAKLAARQVKQAEYYEEIVRRIDDIVNEPTDKKLRDIGAYYDAIDRELRGDIGETHFFGLDTEYQLRIEVPDNWLEIILSTAVLPEINMTLGKVETTMTYAEYLRVSIAFIDDPASVPTAKLRQLYVNLELADDWHTTGTRVAVRSCSDETSRPISVLGSWLAASSRPHEIGG